MLYNGGIGTYVRASDETDADVGDHTNDTCRIAAKELRVKIVVEGGNLGFTQRARIEYALGGGMINTDAIDNSAGVDTSDHEVNLKILLEPAVKRGALSFRARNEVLASCSEEIAERVLRDNRDQALSLSLEQRRSRVDAYTFCDLMQAIESAAWCARARSPPDPRGVERTALAISGADAPRALRRYRLYQDQFVRAARESADWWTTPTWSIVF